MMNKSFSLPINITGNVTGEIPPGQITHHVSQATLPGNRRYLAIFLPRLASDRIIRQRQGMAWRHSERVAGHPDKKNAPAPIGVVARIKNAWRIVHLDELAEQAGLCHGQSLSDARAICPHIDVHYEDGQSDQLLLAAIADWCDRYTPLVSLDAPDGMMLDITGCAHLFGGEKVLADELLQRLFQQGFAAGGAVATTPGAAWAASRYCREKPAFGARISQADIIQPGQEEEALALLPLAGLRLDGETLGGLAKLGLHTIGQVMARPRAPLTRRFGKLLMMRLDQALGRVDEAISPRLPVPALMVERKLVEPIGRVEDVEILVERLAERLCADMDKRGVGARRIDLALFRLDGKVVRLGVGTSSPVRDVQGICRLLSERLTAIHDDFDAGLGFEAGRLSALETEPCSPDQTSLMADEADNRDYAHLIDRLGARLGRWRIQCRIPGETHLPEKVDGKVDENTSNSAGEFNAPSKGKNISGDFVHPIRPVRLFRNPEPVEAIAAVPEGPPVRFRWRRKLHVVVHVEGPERICDEWWGEQLKREGGPRHTRDYFRVEDDSGHRYWLYRQGRYASETNCPNWYMHGIFA